MMFDRETEIARYGPFEGKFGLLDTLARGQQYRASEPVRPKYQDHLAHGRIERSGRYASQTHLSDRS